MKESKPIDVSEVAARYTNADQFERFDAAVSKIFPSRTPNYSGAKRSISGNR
jgi:hypothetical protein